MNKALIFGIRLLLFFCIAWLFFSPGLDGAFVSDFMVWAYKYETQGIDGLPTAFGNFALHQFFQLISYGWYALFGLNETAWGLLQIGIHSLNAALFVSVLAAILKRIGKPVGQLWLYGVALLFLLSPYQTEAVIWSAAMHYLIITTLFLSMLLLLMHQPKGNKWLFVLLAQLLFIAALFSLEMALIIPVLLLIVFLILGKYVFPSLTSKQFFAAVFLPQMGLIAGYFLLNNLAFGAAVGHYGAAKHLNFDPMLVLPAYLKYALKWLSFWRYWNTPGMDKGLYDVLGSAGFIYTFWSVAVVAYVALWTYAAKHSKTGLKLALGLLLLTGVALLPVINLETTSLFRVESDRYGYFASVFLYAFVGVLVLSIRAVPLKRMVLVLMVCVHLGLLVFTVHKWHQAGRLMKSLTESYTWQDSPQVLLLNVPDNLAGVYLFRHGLRESIMFKYHNFEMKDDILLVAKYEMFEPTDSVAVVVKDTESIYEVASCYGGWLSYANEDGNGYTRENYQLRVYDGCWYRVEIYCLEPNRVVIYQSGNHFVEVDATWVPACK